MLMAFLGWWYGAGWRRQVDLILRQLTGLLDMFSFSLLLRTLFSPFRQISAGGVNGPLGVQIQAFFDRTISRFIGALIRTVVMIAGVVVLLFFSIVAVLRIVLWPGVPLVPVIALILAFSGWMPWM